jgi:8-oxo-dGTP pyrophosphatase MutT (NUDIX family)
MTDSTGDPVSDLEGEAFPLIPASAGAMIFDGRGRLLILKPNYKSGWTIPGGVMEATGESPWEACRREVLEETGLDVQSARLAAVDFRRPKPGRKGGIRFLFDCGALTDVTLESVIVQREEIEEFRVEELNAALELLAGPIRRRVRASTGQDACVYLEDGRRVAAVEPVERPGTDRR